GIDDEYLIDRYLVCACESQDRLPDRGIFQGRVFVEGGRDENGKDESNQKAKGRHDRRRPDPPGARRLSKYGVNNNKKNWQPDQGEAQAFQLIAEPSAEGLGSESILVFAVKPFVN